MYVVWTSLKKHCLNLLRKGWSLLPVRYLNLNTLGLLKKKSELQNIINEYSKYPELIVLTSKINKDVVTEIINTTQDNNYGWSLDACFLLKQGFNKETNKLVVKAEFQNEQENLKLNPKGYQHKIKKLLWPKQKVKNILS